MYYAGHGVMDNTTFMVLNGKRMYPLEKMLRSLAKSDGSYVVSVFDCCREKLPPTATRGLNLGDFDQDLDFVPENCQENLIMTFGCRPSAGVPAKSTIAFQYFKYLTKSAQMHPSGQAFIALPGCLNFF